MSAPNKPKTEPSAREKDLINSLSSSFGQRINVTVLRPNRIKVVIDRDGLRDLATFSRDSLRFDHCTNVTGTDFPKDKQIQIDYNLGSIDGEGFRALILTLSCRVSSDDAKLPSLIDIYPSVDLHERETYEMLGVIFTGHPNLMRLLLPEDWNDIPPLLKAYRLPGRLEVE